MNKIKITLNTIKKVKWFVSVISSYECEIDIIQDRYVVDAKSIMGILSLNLLEPLEIRIHSNNDREISAINESIKNVKVGE